MYSSEERTLFTGIVEHVGRIESLDKGPEGGRLRIHAGPLAAALAIAGSVAVNGCCLTVVELAGETFAADLSSETLRRTAFGEMKAGARVNLERPMTAGKEFGGHFMQGHVDGIGRVTRLAPEGANWWFGVRVPAEVERYVVLKGSISIDGISLTVASLADGVAEVAVIPFTYKNTDLQALTAGDAVNLEADILAKYVEKLMDARRAPAPSRITAARLIEEGSAGVGLGRLSPALGAAVALGTSGAVVAFVARRRNGAGRRMRDRSRHRRTSWTAAARARGRGGLFREHAAHGAGTFAAAIRGAHWVRRG
jgi:riboflavin synthase